MGRAYGAYMLQPTKDELRANNRKLRNERDAALTNVADITKQLRETEQRLDEACGLLGRLKVETILARKRAAK